MNRAQNTEFPDPLSHTINCFHPSLPGNLVGCILYPQRANVSQCSLANTGTSNSWNPHIKKSFKNSGMLYQ